METGKDERLSRLHAEPPGGRDLPARDRQDDGDLFAGRNRALEVRAEVFNATNTPFFGAPNTTVGAAAFGTITTAGDPRVIQLAVKFLF